MLAALLFWALALYGAAVIVWQCVTHIRTVQQFGQSHPVAFVLIVKDAERQIEGLLRSLLLRTANGARRHTIYVVDFSDSLETEHIVRRLALRNPCLCYQHLASDDELGQALRQICVNSPSIGCIYDLRTCDMIGDISRDMISMCR